MSSLANVHLSTGARYFVDNICLFLHREGVLHLSEERMEGGSGPEHHSDVEVLTHPPLFTPAKGDGQWVAYPPPLTRRATGRTDEGTRITIPHEGFHEVVLFPEVLSLMHLVLS